MIHFDVKNKSLKRISATEFKSEKILEKYDFQEAIAGSWTTFRKEIGLSECFLIGKEIKPHASLKNSIDLLAFDSNANELIVIELKRDKSKLQLLQAISYAAMVATWDISKLQQNVQNKNSPDALELLDILDTADNVSEKVRIVLVAERYDPEVIIAAQWLHTQYEVNISAFAVNAFKVENRLLIGIEQRYPLKELSEMYENRERRRRPNTSDVDVSWDDVLQKLNFSFAKKAIEFCRSEKEGDPRRKRFVHFRSKLNGFEWIIVNFRIKYLNLYLKGKPSNAEDVLRDKIGKNADISEWAGGYYVNIKTEEEFENMKQWFK